MSDEKTIEINPKAIKTTKTSGFLISAKDDTSYLSLDFCFYEGNFTDVIRVEVWEDEVGDPLYETINLREDKFKDFKDFESWAFEKLKEVISYSDIDEDSKVALIKVVKGCQENKSFKKELAIAVDWILR